MKTTTPIEYVLGVGLHPGWRVVACVETILQLMADAETPPHFRFEATMETDRQVMRLIRPTLAAFAVKYAHENNLPENVFFGPLRFKVDGKFGTVVIRGKFKNMQSGIWIELTAKPAVLPLAEIQTKPASERTSELVVA
jgi:hypothetical protein